jgi:tetratricopeptide (TPR) repeat protein
MGFLSFFRPKLPAIRDPQHLKSMLFDAALKGDQQLLSGLCKAHTATVLEHFGEWSRVPEDVRGDQAALQRYASGLIGVAQSFANELHNPVLLERLQQTPEDNPLTQWQQALAQSRALIGELRYQDAAQLLSDQLARVRGLQGSGVDTYLPITYGHLGECYFQLGEAERALAPTEQALALCQEQGDQAGVCAYLANLYELHRYLGRGEDAAIVAERLGQALEQQGKPREAASYRRRARSAQAGEPLNRVVIEVDGQQFELDEAPPLGDKRIRFVFERNRLSLRRAQAWLSRGEQLGGAGDFVQALIAFQQAAQADRYDPHPRYLEALTLLHLRRYADAVSSYTATEALAPGWFHCRADHWLAQQLAHGQLGHDVFVIIYELEDGPQPPEAKAQLAERALQQTPALAPLLLLYGKNLAQLGRAAAAEAAYRQGLAHVREPDVRTRLLVELGVLLPPGAERISLLQAARDLNGHLVAAAMAAIELQSAGQAS